MSEGRFLPIGVAGVGGMSTVFHMIDRDSGQPVAVKKLRDDVDRERFAREARLLAELSHPAIVRYVAHGQLPSGEPYLAMEWLEGETLQARLARAPLDAGETLLVARRVCEALAAAHALGIVHRDLKPSNLFLVGGRVDDLKLVDFGIARVIDGRMTTITRTGTAMGTPAYMAPEQVRGSRLVDGRTDLFALGAVLCECLTARPAFSGADELVIMSRILSGEPEPLPAETPVALARLIHRLLEKEPRLRPVSAAHVQALLEGASDAPDPPGSPGWYDARAAVIAELAPRLDTEGVLAALTEAGGAPDGELARRAQLRCLADGVAALADLGVDDLARALAGRVVKLAGELRLPDEESAAHVHHAQAATLPPAEALGQAAAATQAFTVAGDETRAALAAARLADLALEAGDARRARAEAERFAPASPRARLALGKALLALGKTADARIELKRVASAGEAWLRAHASLHLARAALRGGHATVAETESRTALTAAAGLASVEPAAREVLAQALRRQGREADALAVEALAARRG